MIWRKLERGQDWNLQADEMTDPETEEEDLMDPKDELKKKIVALVNTMREWNEKTKEARESVRKQLQVIIDLGLNKRKMEKTELRNLINKIFEYHGIHQSWLRKLLPEVLKDTSKTRISYLQRQEIEKERQRLLLSQQQTAQSHLESEVVKSSYLDGHTMEPVSCQPAKLELTPYSQEIKQGFETGYAPTNESLDCDKLSLPPKDSVTIQKEQNRANKDIERLQEDVLWLSKPFVAKAYLQAADQDIPLVAQIDPVKKGITSIQVDENY
jgi:hypothetical protein